MSRHARNAVVAFAQHALGAVSGAAGIFFVARQMPGAKFHLGVIGFAVYFVGIFQVVQRAFDQAHVKRLSEGENAEECLSTFLLLKLAATLTMVALALGSVLVWTEVFGQGFQTPMHVTVLELIVTYQVLNAIGEFARRTFEGRGNIVLGQIILSTEHVVKGAATIWVAFNGLEPLTSGARNALGLGTAYVLGAAALAFVSVALILRERFGRPSRGMVKSYSRFAVPMFLTSAIFSVSASIDTVILQFFWGSNEVGAYFAPQRYIAFLPALAGALGTSLFPVYSRLHAEGRTTPETVQATIRGISLVLLPIVAITVAMPKGIIHVLLSDDFLDAWPVLVVLAIGAYIQSIRMMLSTKVGGVNKPEEITKAAVASVAANIVLSLVLVPDSVFGVPAFGLKALGAALGSALSLLVGMGAVLHAARIHAGVEFPPIWKHPIMFAITTGVLWLVAQAFPLDGFRIFHLLAAGPLSLGVFVLLGRWLGEITDEDITLAKSLVHPRQWLEFLNRET